MIPVDIVIGLGLLVALLSLWAGAAFMLWLTSYLIRTGTRVPKYLRELGIMMPERYRKDKS